jgi:hypothetical protein
MSLGKSNQKVKLFGVFSFKYDSNLVPDLIKNLEFCDGFVIHDDRSNKQKWYHEGETRKMLLEKARMAGADWVLCVDPDERFEISAGQEIRRLIELERDAIYGFPFRELWIEDSYRVDGIWASKVKYVLFPLKEDQIFLNLPVHSPWAPTNENYEKILTEINLYHLKNIPQKNRQQRADLYNELDPLHEIQTIGYDYLADESGIVLKKIENGRKFYPPYQSDYDIVQFHTKHDPTEH